MNYSRSNLPLCRCNANYHKTSGQYELSKNLNHFHFILLALKDEYAYFSFIAIIIFCSRKSWVPQTQLKPPFSTSLTFLWHSTPYNGYEWNLLSTSKAQYTTKYAQNFYTDPFCFKMHKYMDYKHLFIIWYEFSQRKNETLIFGV